MTDSDNVAEDYQSIVKCVNHGRRVLAIASGYGWLPGARYTYTRELRKFDRIGFIDIEFDKYDFKKHLSAVKSTCPLLTVARDVVNIQDLTKTLDQAHELLQYSKNVIVIPKDPFMAYKFNDLIPPEFLLGYSVPTRYGGTSIPPDSFNRPVHLLGGRPDFQRQLAELMPVVSMDCNRFTLDARFGDYFDGHTFRPHEEGGYENCLAASILNINQLWLSYRISRKRALE